MYPSQPATAHCTRPPKKRTRLGDPEPDDDGDDSDDSDDDNRGSEKKLSQDGENLSHLKSWACPCFKGNPVLNWECGNTKLTRFGDVPQHIRRKHSQRPFCSRCGLVTKRSNPESRREELSEHCRQLPECALKLKVRAPPGATPDQLSKLSEKPPPFADPPEGRVGNTQERKWYGIFSTIHPGVPLPRSPYWDPEPAGLLFNYLLEKYMGEGGHQRSAEEIAGPNVEAVPIYTRSNGIALVHFGDWCRQLLQRETQPEELARDHTTFDEGRLEELLRQANLRNNTGNLC